MILADSSIWIDHLHRNNAILSDLLSSKRVCGHAMLPGELAMGSYRKRDRLLTDLQLLPQIVPLTQQELLHFVGLHALFGKGLGFVDAHFLGAVMASQGHTLWTRDKNLQTAAKRLGLAFDPVH
jgi:predicted nucleic acid-binding protein